MLQLLVNYKQKILERTHERKPTLSMWFQLKLKYLREPENQQLTQRKLIKHWKLKDTCFDLSSSWTDVWVEDFPVIAKFVKKHRDAQEVVLVSGGGGTEILC